MKVAAIQMVSGTQRDDNLQAALALLEQAARDGVELAVLPEYLWRYRPSGQYAAIKDSAKNLRKHG